MSDRYDFGKFIDSIKDLDYPEILARADERAASLERISYGVRGAVRARQAGSTELRARIGEFLFFMQTGTKPAGVSDWDFQLYRDVCERLVEKGQFEPEVLEMFRAR